MCGSSGFGCTVEGSGPGLGLMAWEVHVSGFSGDGAARACRRRLLALGHQDQVSGPVYMGVIHGEGKENGDYYSILGSYKDTGCVWRLLSKGGNPLVVGVCSRFAIETA